MIRCHHLIKTFYLGIVGWSDQQLPEGTAILTARRVWSIAPPPPGYDLVSAAATGLSATCPWSFTSGSWPAVVVAWALRTPPLVPRGSACTAEAFGGGSCSNMRTSSNTDRRTWAVWPDETPDWCPRIWQIIAVRWLESILPSARRAPLRNPAQSQMYMT